MSDAITDVERESNEIRLKKLNPEKLAFDLRKKARELEALKEDLEALGYIVERNGNSYKIYREL